MDLVTVAMVDYKEVNIGENEKKHLLFSEINIKIKCIRFSVSGHSGYADGYSHGGYSHGVSPSYGSIDTTSIVSSAISNGKSSDFFVNLTH